MRRLAWLAPWLLMISVEAVAAQTLMTDEPAGQKTWEVLLKLAFPILMTAVGPMATRYVKDWPPPLKYVVASLASMLVGAGLGAVPDFPLGIESAATIGATSGATGQYLYLQHPKG